MSIDYYTRLERGRETRPSPAVVDALARALRLDGDEHEYLKSLAAQAARRAPVPPRPPSRAVRPTVKLLLETLRPNPAYVVTRTYDILAANPGGARLHPGLLDWPPRQRNTIRYTFLHPEARNLYPDWEQKARGCVAQLRAVAGSDPDAPDLAALVGELLVKSPDFGHLWGRYEVRRAGAGDRVLRHPLVGTLHLTHETVRPEPHRRARARRLPGRAGHPGPRRDGAARHRGPHRGGAVVAVSRTQGCQSAAGWVSPVSHAQAAISTRLRTPSLPWMLARWLLTVLREMNSSAAISVLVRPLAMDLATSISRLDNGAASRGPAGSPAARVA